MQGVVVKSSGSVYGVRTNNGAYIDCRVKGNFRLKGIRSTNPVAVGDIVTFDMREDGTAYITDILERKNYIVRKASNLSKQSHILAANLDICFLVVTISHPTTATTFRIVVTQALTIKPPVSALYVALAITAEPKAITSIGVKLG